MYGSEQCKILLVHVTDIKLSFMWKFKSQTLECKQENKDRILSKRKYYGCFLLFFFFNLIHIFISVNVLTQYGLFKGYRN